MCNACASAAQKRWSPSNTITTVYPCSLLCIRLYRRSLPLSLWKRYKRGYQVASYFGTWSWRVRSCPIYSLARWGPLVLYVLCSISMSCPQAGGFQTSAMIIGTLPFACALHQYRTHEEQVGVSPGRGRHLLLVIWNTSINDSIW